MPSKWRNETDLMTDLCTSDVKPVERKPKDVQKKKVLDLAMYVKGFLRFYVDAMTMMRRETHLRALN